MWGNGVIVIMTILFGLNLGLTSSGLKLVVFVLNPVVEGLITDAIFHPRVLFLAGRIINGRFINHLWGCLYQTMVLLRRSYVYF